MAAGGFKTFTTGEVLTSADTNNFLMQGVLVFDDAAARDAAITAPVEGQVVYLKDTNAVLSYDGTSYVGVGGSSPLTTKGDLYTFSTVDARLGVGANGTVLTAASGEATGLEWATPAGGAKNFTLLNAGGTSLSGSSTTISGISGADQIFVMVESASGSSASATISVKINNLTTNQKSLGKTDIINSASNVNIVGDSRTTINLGALSSNAASQVDGVVNIFGCNTSGTKIYQYVGGASTGGGSAQENFVGGGRWDNAATVSSIVIAISSGSFDAGTVRVYTSA